MQFLQDKNIFEHTYFGFMWQMCGFLPTTLPRDAASERNVAERNVATSERNVAAAERVPLMAAKLSASFVLETLIHAKEKVRVWEGGVRAASDGEQCEGKCACVCVFVCVCGACSHTLDKV